MLELPLVFDRESFFVQGWSEKNKEWFTVRPVRRGMPIENGQRIVAHRWIKGRFVETIALLEHART